MTKMNILGPKKYLKYIQDKGHIYIYIYIALTKLVLGKKFISCANAHTDN